ncbi:septation protein SepH [Brevibacterium sp. 50QC2O2]|uniref:septation protein SepH n=1 Tax=Brevibacterium sp. 50QC2O2 TaxID=2968459 RepID=UPI00211C202F|nr:septation protein SepH [Brevibacterium sp. 50QC2O2]MCQ9388378.1 septation protein SepH [Brevibacterium sp. 50QC2O2]
MTDLTLHAIASSGRAIILTDDAGGEYRLELTDELYALIGRARAQLAGAKAGEPVRPRNIQALVRSGMSAEDVVEATGADLEYVRRYEHPVLAERAHIAHLAGQVPIYPDTGSDGGPKPLAELAAERLALREVPSDSLRWDAWKNSGGSWHVQLSFTAAETALSAAWKYERGTVTPLDEEAGWLSDSGPTDSGPIPTLGSFQSDRPGAEAPVEQRGQQRLRPEYTAIPTEPILTRETLDNQAETGRILESLRKRRAKAAAQPTEAQGRLRSVPDEPTGPDAPDGAHTALSRPDDAADDGVLPLPADDGRKDDSTTGASADEPGTGEARRKGRSSIPSWDDIMFGPKKD